MRSLSDDRSIVIKKVDKGSCVLVWDRFDYVKEAEKQLADDKGYNEITYNKKVLSQLVEKSNKYFKGLRSKGFISEKELKYFTYEYKKVCNLGKLYLFPKIHKRLFNVPGRPVISNCGTPTEKVSEFLDYHLKPVIRNGLSYIRESQHFLERIKTIGNIPENAILVTADVVGLYPNVPHQAGLNALKNALEKRDLKKIPTEDLVKMAEFVLKNNLFEFNSKVYQKKSGTAIGTNFHELEQKFLETQDKKLLIWLRYIDDIFFIWAHGEQQLETFLNDLTSFSPQFEFYFRKEQKENTIFRS